MLYAAHSIAAYAVFIRQPALAALLTERAERIIQIVNIKENGNIS